MLLAKLHDYHYHYLMDNLEIIKVPRSHTEINVVELMVPSGKKRNPGTGIGSMEVWCMRGSEPAAPVFYRLVANVATNQDAGMLELVPVVTG